jgi:hypothetical protein
VITVGLAAAIALLVLGGGWRLFAGRSSGKSQMMARWKQAQPVQLQGSVKYSHRSVKLADTDSAIVAWPASFVPDRKFSLSGDQLFAADVARMPDDPMGPFFARVDAQGEFRTQINVLPGMPCDYYVLVVSTNAPGRSSVADNDRAVLRLYFADPDILLGGRRYSLKRCEISSGQEFEIDFLLAEPTARG